MKRIIFYVSTLKYLKREKKRNAGKKLEFSSKVSSLIRINQLFTPKVTEFYWLIKGMLLFDWKTQTKNLPKCSFIPIWLSSTYFFTNIIKLIIKGLLQRKNKKYILFT